MVKRFGCRGVATPPEDPPVARRALLTEADGDGWEAVAAGPPLPLWPWAEPQGQAGEAEGPLGEKGNSDLPEAMLPIQWGRKDVGLGAVCVQEGDSGHRASPPQWPSELPMHQLPKKSTPY